MEEEWISLKELMKRLNVSDSFIRRGVENGSIPSGRLGKILRFPWNRIQKRMLENGLEHINISNSDGSDRSVSTGDGGDL